MEGDGDLAEDVKVEDSAARVVGPNDVEFAVLLSYTLVVISDVVGRAVVVGFGRVIEA